MTPPFGSHWCNINMALHLWALCKILWMWRTNSERIFKTPGSISKTINYIFGILNTNFLAFKCYFLAFKTPSFWAFKLPICKNKCRFLAFWIPKILNEIGNWKKPAFEGQNLLFKCWNLLFMKLPPGLGSSRTWVL